jgi:hypothetical protein
MTYWSVMRWGATVVLLAVTLYAALFAAQSTVHTGKTVPTGQQQPAPTAPAQQPATPRPRFNTN